MAWTKQWPKSNPKRKQQQGEKPGQRALHWISFLKETKASKESLEPIGTCEICLERPECHFLRAVRSLRELKCKFTLEMELQAMSCAHPWRWSSGNELCSPLEMELHAVSCAHVPRASTAPIRDKVCSTDMDTAVKSDRTELKNLRENIQKLLMMILQ